MNYDHLLIVDVEATCDDKDPTFKHRSEIIEFGWVHVDIKQSKIVDTGSWLVKPVHTHITPFCESLTGITSQMIDNDAISWEQVCSRINWMKLNQMPWASWGDYDKHIIERQCRMQTIKNPMAIRHTNIKLLYGMLMSKTRKECSVTAALQELGMDFDGSLHRGGDDAKNIWKIANQIFSSIQH